MFPMFVPIFIKSSLKEEVKPNGYELFETKTPIAWNKDLENFFNENNIKNVILIDKNSPSFVINNNTGELVGTKVMLPMLSNGKFDNSRKEIKLEDDTYHVSVSLKSIRVNNKLELIELLKSSDQKKYIMDFSISDEVIRIYFFDKKHWTNGPSKPFKTIKSLEWVDGELKVIESPNSNYEIELEEYKKFNNK